MNEAEQADDRKICQFFICVRYKAMSWQIRANQALYFVGRELKKTS